MNAVTDSPEQAQRRNRLTIQAWALISAAVLLSLHIIHQGDHVLLSIPLIACIALTIAAWMTPRRLRHADGRWLVPRTIHASQDVGLGCLLSAQHGCPPVVLMAHDPNAQALTEIGEVPGLSCQATRVVWQTRFPRRGVTMLRPLVLIGEQPFGLIRHQRSIGASREVLVLPAIGHITRPLQAQLQRWIEQGPTSATTGDEEISHLRSYRPGDAMHRIHWRVSARMRHLLVAQRNDPASRHIALLLDNDGRPSRAMAFERLVAVTATLVDHLCMHGWLVSLHGPAFPAPITGSRRALLEQLALVGLGPPSSLAKHLPRDVLTVVLTLDASRLDMDDDHALILDLATAETVIQLPRMGR